MLNIVMIPVSRDYNELDPLLNIRVSNMPLHEAVQLILVAAGFSAVLRHGQITISTAENLRATRNHIRGLPLLRRGVMEFDHDDYPLLPGHPLP